MNTIDRLAEAKKIIEQTPSPPMTHTAQLVEIRARHHRCAHDGSTHPEEVMTLVADVGLLIAPLNKQGEREK